MKAIIRLNVPEWQIGQKVKVCFPDTMCLKGTCELEQPKGKWIIHNDYNENCRYGCDQCGNLTNRNSSFCPDCGARMERR